MTSPLTTTELGRIGPPPRPIPADYPRGRPFYLPRIEAAVVVECREQDGWRCRVIARRDHRSNLGHIHVSDDEIAAACTAATVDHITDPDGYAMLWQTRVWQRWPGGHMPMVGRLLAGELRESGTLRVDLTPQAIRRLLLQAHIRPPALRRALGKLLKAGLLVSCAGNS
jgi:hypothetical protein